MREFIDRLGLNSQGRSAFVFVVLIGYLVGVLTASPSLSLSKIVISAILTIAYLYVGFNDDAYFSRYQTTLAKAFYFIILLTFSLTIQFMIGPGSSWLITLPIVTLAIHHLSALWRWVVYISILAGFGLPLAQIVGWQEAVLFTLIFSPAILFVVVFSRMVISAEEAKEEAEQLATQLEEANKQLAAYATQAEELAISNERNRIAREIHDNLGHYLTVVHVQIEAAKSVMDHDPVRAQDALSKALTLTEEGLQGVRQSISALREDPLATRPLPEAIQALVDETKHTGIDTHFSIQGKYTQEEAKTELTLYRAVQEGLTNVRKHAQASKITVVLSYTLPESIQLTITDNGKGSVHPPKPGFGLLGIQERVNLLDGTFQITTNSGEGFRLALDLPRISF